ncbi:MAG TPA: metallophosphoesterase family protein, partial [Saprospiraceae bacterium]|nr:metallophosphoesterase family protein [Saprospiraceae bacterium]
STQNAINYLLIFTLYLVFNVSYAQTPRIYDTPVYPKGDNLPSQMPDRIIINASEDATSKVRISWRTDTTIHKAFLEMALADDAPKFWRNAKTLEATTTVWDATNVKLSKLKAHFHNIELDQLVAGQMYIYRVGDGKYWSEWFQFKTIQNSRSMKILFIGDVQNNILDIGSRLVRQAYQHHGNSDLILYSGDLVNYAHKDTDWDEWFKMGSFIHSTIPSVMTPGNHEYNPATEEDEKANIRKLSVQWRAQFALPQNGPEGLEETSYFIDYPLVRLICLNTNIEGEAQIQWLHKTLANHNKKWTIVFFHHPVFPTVIGRTDTKVGETLIPIFEKYKVDLVLTGHDHAYSRGISKTSELPVYVVSVSGAKMYNVNKGWETFGGIRQRVGENTQLYQTIDVDHKSLNFMSYTVSGQVYDHFKIDKNKKKPKFIDLAKNIPSKLHTNTTHYYDQLPKVIESAVLMKHEGYSINRVVVVKKNDTVQYQVRLRKENSKDVDLVLDVNGNEI